MTEIKKFTINEVIGSMRWTDKECAEILGVSEATVNRKKNGKSEWTVTDLKIISEKAQMPLSQIIL